MLPLLGYFLAAVMVVTGLFPYGEWNMLLFTASILLLSMYYRNYGARISRQKLLILLIVFTLGNILAWAKWAQIPIIGQVQLAVIYVLYLTAAWFSRMSFLNIVTLVFPLIGLVQQWGYGFIGGGPSAGVHLLIWSLACWPFIALMAQGRLLMMSSLSGIIALLSIAFFICAEGDIPSYMIWETTLEFYQYSSIELTIIQCILVIVSVAPLLINSGALWRWTASCGALLIAGPLSIILLCGPWYDGWPPLLWWVLYPAIAALLLGIVGMLCTVRRPELLYETSVRALSLGIGASAVLLLPLIYEIPGREEIISLLAPALAPCIWGVVLAIVIMGSGLIAHSGDAPIMSTESWEKSKSRVAINLKLRISSLTKDILRDMKREDSRWLNPSSYVPFFIFLSTWTVFLLFDEYEWVCFFGISLSLLSVNILRHSLLLWAIVQMTLVYVSALWLGMHWLIAFSCTGPALFILWLFVRWPKLNPAWAYVTCLMILCIAYVPFEMIGGDPIPVLLLCALLVLLCNGIQEGGARWMCLPLMSISLICYLMWWVYLSDPFAMIEMSYQDEWDNFWFISCRVLVLVCILYALMLCRHYVEDRQALWGQINVAQRTLICSSLVLVIAWCLSWRPGIWESLIVLFIMIWNAQWMYAYLRDCTRDQIRWPLLDALTLTLAAMVISAGECYVYYLSNQRTTGTVSAGALGSFVNSAKHDLLACMWTVIVVFIGMRLDFMRRMIQRFINLLLFFKRWKSRSAEAGSTATDAADGAGA